MPRKTAVKHRGMARSSSRRGSCDRLATARLSFRIFALRHLDIGRGRRSQSLSRQSMPGAILRWRKRCPQTPGASGHATALPAGAYRALWRPSPQRCAPALFTRSERNARLRVTWRDTTAQFMRLRQTPEVQLHRVRHPLPPLGRSPRPARSPCAMLTTAQSAPSSSGARPDASAGGTAPRHCPDPQPSPASAASASASGKRPLPCPRLGGQLFQCCPRQRSGRASGATRWALRRPSRALSRAR